MSEDTAQPEAEDHLLGKVLVGRYHIEERIGEGGMGTVYRATQEPLGRSVVVKVLRREFATDQQYQDCDHGDRQRGQR